MILQSLRELALREGLVDDPAFESKPVRWVIELDGDGRFLYVNDTNSPEILPEGSKKKPRQEATLMVIPRRQVRPGKQVKPNFLVDNAKYVLGHEEEAAVAPEAKSAEAFLQALIKAQRDIGSPELEATLLFLKDREEKAKCIRVVTETRDFASNDLFTFKVDGSFLHESEALRAHWVVLNEPEGDPGGAVQCLVCGEQRVPARLHHQIQIRGASSAGVPLVAFNAGAFEKYGWDGNSNAPICIVCMTAYVEALRRLTRARYDDPQGKRLQPLSTVLNGDTTAVYWADLDSSLVSILPSLRDAPEKVQKMLQSPRAGQAYSLRPKDRFFCLILTGVQGRAIVRRMHTGTVTEVERNLRRYFAAIDVERFDREAPLPQFRLLQSMVLNGELDRLPAELGTELWLHALFGEPLSRSFLAAVVTRNRAERKVTAERAALLHLFFASHAPAEKSAEPATHPALPTLEIARPMSLDRDTKDPPYLLGRLLAALESLQIAAQGQNLNRTLVDRTFGAASTRPGVVFPQLIHTAQHHLAKAGKKVAARAVFLDKLLGEIMDGLEIHGFSPTLNLEQQGRFALGYYHQRQSFYRKSDPSTETPEIPNDASEETPA